MDHNMYATFSLFLADINNARSVINQEYIKNLKKLKKFVMIVNEGVSILYT